MFKQKILAYADLLFISVLTLLFRGKACDVQANGVISSIVLIYILFCPGYLFLTAILPYKREFSIFFHIAIGIGISIVLLLFWGLILEPFPGGLSCTTITGTYFIFVTILLLIGAFQRTRIIKGQMPTDSMVVQRIKEAAITIVVFITGISLLLTLVSQPLREYRHWQESATNTEFFIDQMKLDSPQPSVHAIVNNHMNVDRSYTVLMLDELGNTVTIERIVDANSSWGFDVPLVFDAALEEQRIELQLFESNNNIPDRTLYFWVHGTIAETGQE